MVTAALITGQIEHRIAGVSEHLRTNARTKKLQLFAREMTENNELKRSNIVTECTKSLWDKHMRRISHEDDPNIDLVVVVKAAVLAPSTGSAAPSDLKAIVFGCFTCDTMPPRVWLPMPSQPVTVNEYGPVTLTGRGGALLRAVMPPTSAKAT